MTPKLKVMLLQTRHIESISYLAAEIVKAFPHDTHEVTVVYLESGEPSDADAYAKECFFLGLSKTDYKGLRLKAIQKLGAFLREHHFDVIIANMYKPINLLMHLRHALTASLCIGIIHAFGEFDRLGRRLMMRWMIDQRWQLVAVSEPLRDYLISAGCGLHKKNTLVINNAIDLPAIERQALDHALAREQLGLPAKGLVFGTVGRCVYGKRHLELIKAFELFMGTRQDVFLVIVGDGELHPELMEFVQQHQLQGKVYLTGYVPEALRYLRALDVFVFPSESEGFGMALLEAMALSLPTIVNRVEPLTSIVADAGAVVDTTDIVALAQMMNVHYQLTQTERELKGAANYRRVCEHYNIEAYRQAYRELVQAHFPENKVN